MRIHMEEYSSVPVKGPTTSEVRIAQEAADYRNYMFGVLIRRGMEEPEARAQAAAMTDAQLAQRMQELEAKRKRRGGL
jgi:hypothetical protein